MLALSIVRDSWPLTLYYHEVTAILLWCYPQEPFLVLRAFNTICCVVGLWMPGLGLGLVHHGLGHALVLGALLVLDLYSLQGLTLGQGRGFANLFIYCYTIMIKPKEY